MSDMLEIKIKKGRDGKSVLTCTRPDGTSTWTHVSDYFPLHDMTHFVVESTLKIPNAFYSLVLDGWNIEDFAVKGVGKTLPNEANLVEAIVGRLQQTVMPGSGFTAESFNDEVVAVLEGIENPARRPVSKDELEMMRSRLKELLAQYSGTPAGESITLNFERIS